MKVITINGYTIYRKFKRSDSNGKFNLLISSNANTCQPIEPRLRGIRNVL